MSKKKKHEEHEEHVNHEAWVIPYADMLTLLMGLFLVLWSMGQTDLQKMKEMSAGFASAMGMSSDSASGSTAGSGTTGADYNPIADSALSGNGTSDAQEALATQKSIDAAKATEQQQLGAVKQELSERIAAAGLAGQVELKLEPRGLVVVVTDGLLFDSGSATLVGSAQDALATVAEPLLAVSQPIVIEGHTDDQPIASGSFPTNWELSTARATAVLRYMIDRFGFAGDRLSATGYAATHPVADNATAGGRAANRRVEILVAAVAGTSQVTSGSGESSTTSGSSGSTTTTVYDPIGDPLADLSTSATEG